MKRKSNVITVEDLKSALASRDSSDRVWVFMDFCKQRPSIEVLPVLRKALRCKDSTIVNCAAESIEKLGTAAEPAMHDLYIAAKTADESGVPQSFPECIRALVSIQAEEELILEAIHHWVGVTNWEIVSSGMAALQKIGTPKALKLLRRIHTFWYEDLNKQQQRMADKFLLPLKGK
jgi:hypothetical protein